MNFKFIRSLAKPFLFWSIFIGIGIEIILHYKFNLLPLKILNHTTGPIQRLGQYSKKNVIPSGYIALIGDSNVYGFGPWLYDNSWSMKQPSFATHHLLHESLNKDVVAYGYPGFGTFGYSLSAVAEYKMISESLLWEKHEAPKHILIVFYEGNDLFNNLHEVQQRGVKISNKTHDDLVNQVSNLFDKELGKLQNEFSILDQLVVWNITSGIIKNYFNKFSSKSEVITEQNEAIFSNSLKEIKRKNNDPENTAIINGEKVHLGYLEGPALHLTESEISISLEITKQSFEYVKEKFPQSQIDVVYLSTALSLYDFNNSNLRPAPLKININSKSSRDRIFSSKDIKLKNQYLRKAIELISKEIKIGFIDTTNEMKKLAKNYRLHGPRDPIHLNRKGYETFAEIIRAYLIRFNQPFNLN